MAGKVQPLSQKSNYKDPFTAGQMVGMLVMLTFVEQNDGIKVEILDRLKTVSAESLQEYFEKPTEDIFLMIDNIVKEIKVWKQLNNY